MKRLGPLVDRLAVSDLVGILALLGLGIGVAWVLSPGWALIVVSILIIGYLILPDQRPPE